jgi:hypothetical protein
MALLIVGFAAPATMPVIGSVQVVPIWQEPSALAAAHPTPAAF